MSWMLADDGDIGIGAGLEGGAGGRGWDSNFGDERGVGCGEEGGGGLSFWGV